MADRNNSDRYGLVSVIMPTYNAANWVRDSIESVLSQTYQNLELIITDDCSTDGTRDILAYYEMKDPRVTVIYESCNLGAGHTRNRCIEHAKGRYIAFCDSDDRWMPEKLEKQLAFISEMNCCMVYSSYITCDEQGVNNGIIIAPRRQSLFQTKCDDKIGFLTCIYDTTKTGGKMYLPVLRKRQDYAYELQILQKCRYAYGIQEPLAYYRLHSNSISANKWSLVKFEMLTWREVFGDSRLHAALFFFFCFLPSYFLKCIFNKVAKHRNRHLWQNMGGATHTYRYPTHKHLLVILLFLVQGILLLNAKTDSEIWDYKELKEMRTQPTSQQYLKIIRMAEEIIKQQPVAVTDKTVCLSGNIHHYESLSIYWWPNPNNPGGPYIARDGEYNPEYKQYDYPRLMKLRDNLVTCGKAFFLTNDNRYYDFLCRQIDLWFIDRKTYMTPDFEYSQIIPGRNDGKGNPQGLVDAYIFNSVIDAATFVDSFKPLGKKRMRALKRWMYDFAKWMETSHNGKVASQYINNQAIAYETTLFNIYTFTSHKSKAKKHASICISHIKSQIEDDGRQPQEMKRAKPQTYVNFNLDHMEYFLSKCPRKIVDREALEKVAKARQFAEAMRPTD